MRKPIDLDLNYLNKLLSLSQQGYNVITGVEFEIVDNKFEIENNKFEIENEEKQQKNKAVT